MAAPGSHYFDEDPAVGSSPQSVELWLPDTHLVLNTDHGVFGYNQIDTGTKLLLLNAPSPCEFTTPESPCPDSPTGSGGDLLDLGCGSGAIALVLARRCPQATVWAVDINARARELCAANALANDIGNVRVVAPDGVPAEVCFTTIWSNPPIRIGKPALHALLQTWMSRLADHGQAVLVVHKHLGADSLQRWLTASGWPTIRLSSGAGYRLLQVHR